MNMNEALEPISLRPGYRRSVATEEVNLFVGWDYIFDLIGQVDPLIYALSKRREAWESAVLSAEALGTPKPRGRPPRRVEYTPENILMHKASIALFFLTGGRISEILGIFDEEKGEWISPPLRPTNFRLDLDPDFVFVEAMQVIKRYQKKDYEIVQAEKPANTSPAHFALWHHNKETGLYERKK